MLNNYEDQVRALAYQIWESEGRPIGHEHRHWDMASKLVDSHDDAGLGNVLTTISNGEIAAESYNINPIVHDAEVNVKKVPKKRTKAATKIVFENTADMHEVAQPDKRLKLKSTEIQ
mgnify:FL=1